MQLTTGLESFVELQNRTDWSFAGGGGLVDEMIHRMRMEAHSCIVSGQTRQPKQHV